MSETKACQAVGEKCLDHIALDHVQNTRLDFDFTQSVASLSLSMAQNGDSCQNSETTVSDCGRGEMCLRFYRMVLFRIQK